MVSPGKRRMKYKHKKTSSGTKKEYFKGKHKKARCAITGNALAGVPHEKKSGLRKKSKSEKRPSAPFGGILSGVARHEVFVEKGKVAAGIKNLEDVDLKYRKFVKQTINAEETN